MLGFSNDDAAKPRKRKKSHLEFNFITGGAAPSARAHKNKPRPAQASAETGSSVSEPEPPQPEKTEAVVSSEPVKPIREEKTAMSTSSPSPSSNPNPANPAPIRTSSIERQIKEQKTVSNMLNGVALALVCGVLLVAALAGTGGYVLWKQMQDQSASLAILEQNTKDRLFDLKAELVASDADITKLQEQSNMRLVELTAQFESHRSETAQMLAELKANNRSLERSLTLYQRKVQEQETQMAQLRRFR